MAALVGAPGHDAHELHNPFFSHTDFRSTVECAKMAFLSTQNVVLLCAHMPNLFPNVLGKKKIWILGTKDAEYKCM